MQTQLVCLSLAACLFTSCEKSRTKDQPADTSSKAPQVERRDDAPAVAENPAPERRESPAVVTPGFVDPPVSDPADPEKIRPAGTAPDDASWASLTAEQRIEKFASNGIARLPREVSDRIITEATKGGAPEDQLDIITRQAAAWHHFNRFKNEPQSIPDHMKRALLERLSSKYGESWLNMVTELDEQIAASAKVDALRGKGIPGLSPDESQDFFIQAIEKYGADYKAILAAAEQAAKE